jgi:hypothetical protein
VTRASRRKVVLTVHIAAALSLLGASTVLFVGGLHAATRDDPQEARDAYTLLRLLTFSVDIPLAIVALLAGLVLASWATFGATLFADASFHVLVAVAARVGAGVGGGLDERPVA